jgi:hypothetical protein
MGRYLSCKFFRAMLYFPKQHHIMCYDVDPLFKQNLFAWLSLLSSIREDVNSDQIILHPVGYCFISLIT